MALLGDSDEWNLSYEFDAAVPVSGIYLCTGCGKELTARKGERFPHQNQHRHTDFKIPVHWRLVLKTAVN
ncbi:protein L [Pseudomonas vanderleydeniana]|nr:protein L [Pseudomonas vanderleydeniana]